MGVNLSLAALRPERPDLSDAVRLDAGIRLREADGLIAFRVCVHADDSPLAPLALDLHSVRGVGDLALDPPGFYRLEPPPASLRLPHQADGFRLESVRERFDRE